MARTSASTSESAPPKTATVGGSDPPRKLGLATTTSLVVASMVGTGVFTTTGILVPHVPSAAGIVWCWGVSGILALFGALAYAELGTAYPETGGEYRFLSRLLHPAVGFLSAFVSLIVGFAAPLAALALAFGDYLRAVWPGAPPALSGAVLIVALSILNGWRVSSGAGLHNLFTALKVALVAAIAGLGMWRGDPARLSAGPSAASVLATPGFAVGLVLVSFSYTGWNAAAYVAGEVRDPTRTLPRALFLGTAGVTILYVLLNAAFVMVAPLEALEGKPAVAHAAAVASYGALGGRILSAVIAVGLVSTVGALIVTGPRVYEAVGEDFGALSVLARRRGRGGPTHAIALQSGLALSMVAWASFGELVGYIGFTLSLFAGLTVACVFVLRARGIAAPYRMLGYPVTPALFVALTGWMMVSSLREQPWASLAGLATLAVGGVLYAVLRHR